MMQNGGTGLVPSGGSQGLPATSGRGLQRTYGQFSEVPPELGGPSQPRLGYIHNGEVQPPPRETFGKPATRMGPLIEGELAHGAERGVMGRVLGLLGGRGLAGTMAAGGEAALGPMGAVIAAGDGRGSNSLSDMQGLTSAYKAARAEHPAIPAGTVTSAPLPPIPQGPTPNDQVANRFGGMQPPSPMTPNQQVADRFGQFQAPSSGGGLPGWLTGANLALGSGGFLQGAPAPRPPQPQQPPAPAVNPNGSIAGAQGPTSVGGAPLQQPMGFFQRNAAMMRDPVTGQLIDPQGAARAQQQDQGGLIQRMLGYLGSKQG